MHSFLVSILVFIITGCLWALMGKKRRKRKNNGTEFPSKLMLRGHFPPKANICSPVINVLVCFSDGLPDESSVKSMMTNDFLKFKRFACTPVVGENEVDWVQRDFDCSKHLFKKTVGSDEEFMDFLEKTSPKDLVNNNVPIWEIFLISNTAPGGREGMFLRIHHSIGDGLALVALVSAVLRDAKGNPFEMALPFKRKPAKNFGLRLGLAGKIIGALQTILTLDSSPYDSDLAVTPKNRKELTFSGKRSIVIFPDLTVPFVKALAKAAKVSFNDIMFAAYAGTFRRYCECVNDPNVSKKGVQLRALLPVAFPRPSEETKDPARVLQNKFVFLSCGMPIGEPDIAARVNAVSAETTQLKNSPLAPLQMWMESTLAPLLPVSEVWKKTFEIFSRHSVVFSNVPGPSEVVMAAGKTVSALQMIFPNLISQVGVLSYAGKVHANIVVDPEIISKPQCLKDCYVEEFRGMADVYKVEFPAGLQ